MWTSFLWPEHNRGTEGGEDWGEHTSLPLIPQGPCLAAPSHLSCHLEMSGHCLPMSAMLNITTELSASLTEFHFGGEPCAVPEPETHTSDTSDTVENPATF
jgi:hypothetical protein